MEYLVESDDSTDGADSEKPTIPTAANVARNESFNDQIRRRAKSMQDNRTDPLPEYVPSKRTLTAGSANIYCQSANTHLGTRGSLE